MQRLRGPSSGVGGAPDSLAEALGAVGALEACGLVSTQEGETWRQRFVAADHPTSSARKFGVLRSTSRASPSADLDSTEVDAVFSGRQLVDAHIVVDGWLAGCKLITVERYVDGVVLRWWCPSSGRPVTSELRDDVGTEYHALNEGVVGRVVGAGLRWEAVFVPAPPNTATSLTLTAAGESLSVELSA